MAERPPPAAIVRAGLTPGAAALVVAAVVTAFVLADAFVLAHRTVGWVVACSVVALLVDPLVTVVSRFVPRWVAVIVTLLAVLAVIATLVAGVAADLLDSIDELQENAPVAARSLEERYAWLADMELADRTAQLVEELDDRVRQDAVSEAVGTAPTYVVTGILMLFLLAYGRRYFTAFTEQFSAERAARIRRVGREAATRGRRYLLVALAHGILNGIVVGLVCWLLDVPAAFSLGFLAGAFTVIPLMGVIVGGIPALLLAFGLDGWASALWLGATLVALQVVEAAVVRPLVDARSVRLGPTIPLVVGLLWFELYGVGGAVYAIAVAVIALAALDSAGRMRGEDVAPAVT